MALMAVSPVSAKAAALTCDSPSGFFATIAPLIARRRLRTRTPNTASPTFRSSMPAAVAAETNRKNTNRVPKGNTACEDMLAAAHFPIGAVDTRRYCNDLVRCSRDPANRRIRDFRTTDNRNESRFHNLSPLRATRIVSRLSEGCSGLGDHELWARYLAERLPGASRSTRCSRHRSSRAVGSGGGLADQALNCSKSANTSRSDVTRQFLRGAAVELWHGANRLAEIRAAASRGVRRLPVTLLICAE